MTTIGVLHPGEMGAAIGRELAGRGDEILWASAGRSDETAARAAAGGFTDAGTLAALVARAEIVFAVSPPSAALELAAAVVDQGFSGCYADLNAISVQSAERIARRVQEGGADFVDGGIVGPPPSAPGSTRVFLSGDRAPEIAHRFAGTRFDAVVIDGGAGAASALKACYAGWTKTTNALLLAVRAAARAHGVEDALLAEWARSQPDLAARSERAAASSAPKAWRFVGEMEEHAATFAAAGVPAAFHAAAAEVYARIGPPPAPPTGGSPDGPPAAGEVLDATIDSILGANRRA